MGRALWGSVIMGAHFGGARFGARVLMGFLFCGDGSCDGGRNLGRAFWGVRVLLRERHFIGWFHWLVDLRFVFVRHLLGSFSSVILYLLKDCGFIARSWKESGVVASEWLMNCGAQHAKKAMLDIHMVGWLQSKGSSKKAMLDIHFVFVRWLVPGLEWCGCPVGFVDGFCGAQLIEKWAKKVRGRCVVVHWLAPIIGSISLLTFIPSSWAMGCFVFTSVIQLAGPGKNVVSLVGPGKVVTWWPVNLWTTHCGAQGASSNRKGAPSK